METILLSAEISADGNIHIDARTGLGPGPAEVVLVVAPVQPAALAVDDRLQAVRRLASLRLPVADVETLNREAMPSERELLP
jgi:phage-related baseplate assembly protein